MKIKEGMDKLYRQRDRQTYTSIYTQINTQTNMKVDKDKETK